MAHAPTALLLAAALALPAVAADRVYRTVDEDGNVVFTDTPEQVRGATTERVELPEYSTYTPPVAARPTVRLSPPDAPPTDGLPTEYRVVLLEPGAGATVRSNPGTLTVTGQVSPSVPNGHVLELLLDGTVRERASGVGPQVSLQLDAVDRGEHQVQLRVVDAGGTPLGSSAAHTVYLQRISVLSPRRQAN